VQEYSVGPGKRGPKQLFFYRPRMVSLPPEKRQSSRGTFEIRRNIKIFNVGAVSIQVRVPFEAMSVEELIGYHNLVFGNNCLEDEVSELAEQVRQQLEPYCVRPVPRLGQSENYTVFYLYELPKISGSAVLCAEEWLVNNRQQVAGLLMQERIHATLSEQETVESTEQYLTYYDTDLVVVDWDAALVVGEQDSLDDILHVMELANVQLIELEAYDRILDGALDMAYRDLARRRMRVNRETHRNLREIRVDLARLSDELLNTTKFFGDWHLARIYGSVSGRFHLADWHKIIKEKLDILGGLYQMLQQDSVNFWMVVLETTIVLLFIIDLVLLLAGR